MNSNFQLNKLKLCLFVSLVFLPEKNCLQEEYLKFGFISPTDGLYGYLTNAAATTMAIEKAKKDGLWENVNVT